MHNRARLHSLTKLTNARPTESVNTTQRQDRCGRRERFMNGRLLATKQACRRFAFISDRRRQMAQLDRSSRSCPYSPTRIQDRDARSCAYAPRVNPKVLVSRRTKTDNFDPVSDLCSQTSLLFYRVQHFLHFPTPMGLTKPMTPRNDLQLETNTHASRGPTKAFALQLEFPPRCKPGQ